MRHPYQSQPDLQLKPEILALLNAKILAVKKSTGRTVMDLWQIIVLGVLGRQCLARRIGDWDTLRQEITAWTLRRNQANWKINWRFTTGDARIKLRNSTPHFTTDRAPAASLTSALSETQTPSMRHPNRRSRQSKSHHP